jgi:hypothetical protein
MFTWWLRRHPQQQHVHTTTLSEFVVYRLLERDKKVGFVPPATAQGTDVLLFQKGIWNGPCYWEAYSLPRGYCRYIPTPTSFRPLIGTSIYTSSFTQKGVNRQGQYTKQQHVRWNTWVLLTSQGAQRVDARCQTSTCQTVFGFSRSHE